MRKNEVENLLKIHGIRPSLHRMRIYEYLLHNRIHPNVDSIYQELIKEIPTLSKTTLYNTLDLFVEKGLVLLITIAENEKRYDADTSLHGHFICKNCRHIFDVRIGSVKEVLADLEGFDVHEKQIYFKGLCPGCLAHK